MENKRRILQNSSRNSDSQTIESQKAEEGERGRKSIKEIIHMNFAKLKDVS